MKYCPMCNWRTGTAYELDAPFMVETCEHCGFVHKVTLVDVDPREPIRVPTVWFPRRAHPWHPAHRCPPPSNMCAAEHVRTR